MWHVPFFRGQAQGSQRAVEPGADVVLRGASARTEPDHPREIRGSVKNYLIHTTDGQCWRNSTMENRFNEAITTAAPSSSSWRRQCGPPYAGARKPPSSQEAADRQGQGPTRGRRPARARPPAKSRRPARFPARGRRPAGFPARCHPRRWPPPGRNRRRRRRRGAKIREEDSSDDDDAGHAGVMGRKMAATRGEAGAAIMMGRKSVTVGQEDSEEDSSG